MKIVILAGGFGTRISEETSLKPKPMINIGGQPILWHIMKIYSYYGYNEFIICCGYKGNVIKEYFANYKLYNSDITFDFKNDTQITHAKRSENWIVTLVDTGINSMTGGRINRIKKYVENDPYFMLTYGDGVADININKLVNFHTQRNQFATLTAVYPQGRFGALDIKGDRIKAFKEKPKGDGSYINGGFFVLSPEIFNYLDNDKTVWEQEPLMKLARDNQLNSFKHDGFWHPMDTLRDKQYLENLYSYGNAPWVKW